MTDVLIGGPNELTETVVREHALRIKPLLEEVPERTRKILILHAAGYEDRLIARDLKLPDEHTVHTSIVRVWPVIGMFPFQHHTNEGRKVLQAGLALVLGKKAEKPKTLDDEILEAAANMPNASPEDQSLLKMIAGPRKLEQSPKAYARLCERLGLRHVPEGREHQALLDVYALWAPPETTVAPTAKAPEPPAPPPAPIPAPPPVEVCEPEPVAEVIEEQDEPPASETEPTLQMAHPEPPEPNQPEEGETMCLSKVALKIEDLPTELLELLEAMAEFESDAQVQDDLEISKGVFNGLLRKLYERLGLDPLLDGVDKTYRRRTALEALGLYRVEHPKPPRHVAPAAEAAPKLAAAEEEASGPETKQDPLADSAGDGPALEHSTEPPSDGGQQTEMRLAFDSEALNRLPWEKSIGPFTEVPGFPLRTFALENFGIEGLGSVVHSETGFTIAASDPGDEELPGPTQNAATTSNEVNPAAQIAKNIATLLAQEKLTPLELDTLSMNLKGLSRLEIAQANGVSGSAVGHRFKVLFEKLGVPLPDGQIKYGPGERELLAEGYRHYLAATQVPQEPTEVKPDVPLVESRVPTGTPETASPAPQGVVSTDPAVIEIAGTIRHLVADNAFTGLEWPVLVRIGKGLSNGGIAESIGNVRLNSVASVVSRLYNMTRVPLPKNHTKYCAKERELLGQAVEHYLATKDGLTETIKEELAEPAVPPKIDPDPQAVTGEKPAEPVPPEDSEQGEEVGGDDTPPAETPADEPESPPPAEPEEAMNKTENDPPPPEPETPESPVVCEAGGNEGPTGWDLVVLLPETPPESAPAEAQLPTVMPSTGVGEVITSVAIVLADPRTVIDAEVLDPRVPDHKDEKRKLIGMGYRIEGFQSVVAMEGSIMMPVLVKRST